MTTGNVDLLRSPTTLTPIPSVLYRGLTAASCLGFVSAITTSALLVRLIYKLVKDRWAQLHRNQVLLLILMLLCADLQQAIAIMLDTQWLMSDAIIVNTSQCWTQAWLMSIGGVSSGVFTLTIACHTFADIIYNHRLTHRTFLAVVTGLWTFVYVIPLIGIGMHPTDFYSRSGAWCWVNFNYIFEQLYLHYIWVLTAEFGTILVYAIMFLALRNGLLHSSHYTVPGSAVRARRAAKIIILYPLVYTLCTVPLAVARLSAMAGRDVGWVESSFAGAMQASNGWMDVVLYCLTRRALIFESSRPAGEMRALDTFDWSPEGFGTTTIIEATPPSRLPPLVSTQRWLAELMLPSSAQQQQQHQQHQHADVQVVGEDTDDAGIRLVVTTYTEVLIRHQPTHGTESC